MPAAFRSTAVEYRPAIDGLRAIAVLAVFVFHLNRRWLPGGFFGVDIFFVISGYLITSVILRDCEGERFRLGRFYQRRIARLLPAFVVVAIATLIGAALVYSPQDLASTGATLSAAAASIANLKFLMQGNYFVLSPDSQPFLHCWSLSVEEQFYLLFPAAFFLLYRKTSAYRPHVLTAFLALSFFCYLALNHARPEWAFYLLPARAWELLAGSVLAAGWGARWRLAYVGVILIAISFFGGQYAILPVAGALCLLMSGNGRVLSSKPLVLVGRMSYSLYLWHWPVFSLVDYRFYWQSSLVRLVLKIAISLLAAAASYYLIEQRGRLLLNRPGKMRIAYAALACSLATLIPLGIVVRNANYVNADARAIRGGGLHFNPTGKSGSMVLMGDSNGSMYGQVAKEIARERDLRLDVISVEAGDPLPHSAGRSPSLWLDSLAVVKRERPDFLLLVCNWTKLRDDRDRLAIALQELRPYARSVLLITQPPVLPGHATREAIRNGARPPFREDAGERSARLDRNELVKSAQGDRVTVIDIEPLFSRDTGEIRFADDRRTLYQDRDHLSVAGASLVKPELIKAMTRLWTPDVVE
jgi:peptidoglycan/LPS O-acetylase OafA/YrhL